MNAASTNKLAMSLIGLLITLIPTPLLAQADGRVATGSSPASPITAPYKTSTGATVPQPAEPALTEAGRLSHSEKRDDKIDRSICKGCD